MAILGFNEIELMGKLEQLPEDRRTAFAAACAERLLLAYARFSERTGRGNLDGLRTLLGRLWDDLAGSRFADEELDSVIEDCMGLIPPEDDEPWVIEQAAAEDAASAVAYALRCRRSGSAQEAAWAARRAYEALDHYVINREKMDLSIAGIERRVLAHPVIQAELLRQQRDLHELLNGTVTANELRERSKREAELFLS